MRIDAGQASVTHISCPASLDYAELAPQNPLFPSIVTSASGRGKSRNRQVQQARRRAIILAHARELVAKDGYEHVAIRRLATASGVSPPTIYSLIGSRDEVLHSAIAEAHLAKVAFASARARMENINPVLAYADTLWISLSREPEYSRNLIRAIIHPTPDRQLCDLVFDIGKTAILSWIVSLDNRGNIARRVNLLLLSELVNRQIMANFAAWAIEGMSLAELRRNLALSLGFMLLGIVDADEAVRIEAWLSQPWASQI